ncbi:DUF4831 family protein [Desulfovibrio sp. JC022]|uniref:DUF4831 family protein n=1 Tax=Desulfovibrio sp. JC022 TaxID=2593642 RepID=UPI0013D7B2BE|nr:DUF4831 family protein [Desulfovibrio sp. JC022]NDV22054.1 DUF4831 family protein [Desulfovibrio sp. JC022]
MFKKTLFVISFLLLLAGCTTTTVNVYPVKTLVNDGDLVKKMAEDKSQGFFYSLPKTVLNVAVTVQKIDRKPGAFWANRTEIIKECDKYIGKFKGVESNIDVINNCMGLKALLTYKKAVQKPNVDYKVSDISIVTSVEPDTENQFYVEVDDDSFTANSLKMTLAEYGMISDAAMTTTDKSLDYAVAGLKATASIAGSFFGLGSVAKSGGLSGYSLIFRQALAEYKKYNAELTEYGKFLTFSKAQQAVISKEMYGIAKANYIARINEYKSSFIGSETKTSKTFTVKFSPGSLASDGMEHIDLFDYYDSGIVYSSDKRLRFDKKVYQAAPSSAEGVTHVALKVDPALDGSVDKLKDLSSALCVLAGKDKTCNPSTANLCSSPPCGLAYRIPGMALVSISANDNILKSEELMIAQRGLVAFLPRTVTGSQSGLAATYYGESGALKTVSVDKAVPEASSISGLGEAASVVGTFGETKKLQSESAKATAKASIAQAKYNEAKAKDDLRNLEESFSAGTGEEE